MSPNDPARYLPALRGLWGELPNTHSLMQTEGPKYKQLRGAPTLQQLRAHLRGDLTLAEPLIGADGLARAAAADADTGGEAAVWALIEAAADRGIWSYGFALDSGEHNAGHWWCPFEETNDPRRFRYLAGLVITAAELSANTERWPNGPKGDLRLPFGVHVRAGRRGVLLLLGPAGERLRFDLDTPDGLLDGLAAVAAHDTNPIALLPEAPPEPEPIARAMQTAAPVAARRGENPIAAFNAAHDVRDLWQQYGGRVSGITGACNCGVAHSHDTQASFTDEGCVVFYTSRCAWAPERRDRNGRAIADAFDLYALVEHGGNKKAAVVALRAQQPRPAPCYPNAPGDADRRYTDPAQVEARQRDAERKREQRRQVARANRQDALDRAAEDPALAACATRREVLQALFDVADERDWCRPSIAQLVERTGKPERTVQRALAWLESRYIATEAHDRPDGQRQALGARPGNARATPRRTFLREPLQPVVTLQTAVIGVTSDENTPEPPSDISDSAVVARPDAPPADLRGDTARGAMAPVYIDQRS